MLFRILVMTLLSAAIVLTAARTPAHAQTAAINDAKQAGVVGERIDGYLGFVDNGPADASLRRQVQEINAKRRAAYDQVAKDTETTTEQVARITAEKQISRARSGEFFLNTEGKWVRKP